MSLPRAREEDLVVTELDGELLAYDLKNYKAHCLNPTAALVWKSCNGRRTAAEIARQAKIPLTEEAVWLALRQLNYSRGPVTGGHGPDVTARGSAESRDRGGHRNPFGHLNFGSDLCTGGDVPANGSPCTLVNPGLCCSGAGFFRRFVYLLCC